MWIVTEWQYISQEVILKDHVKCCTSIAMDETDDMLWNDSKEGGNVRSVRKIEEVMVKTETH